MTEDIQILPGIHILFDLFHCDPERLTNEQSLFEALEEVVREAHLTRLASCVHRFPNGGLTAVLLLSQSHLSLHTWPEAHYAAVDLFTCGGWREPAVAADLLQKALAAREASFTVVERGPGSGVDVRLRSEKLP